MEGEKISEVVNGRREDIRSCKWKERRYQKKKDIKSSSFRSIVWFCIRSFLDSRTSKMIYDCDLLCLMPLSAIFQLYHGDQF
jgi:lipopolysaccharide biosynthesis glycosyltransferase